MLAYVLDALAALQVAVVAAGGGKPKKPRPVPRPRTRVDDERHELRLERQSEIINLFAPGRM